MNNQSPAGDSQHDKAIADYKFFAQLQALAYVEKIILFGSRARGDYRPHSDIDLAIECSKATPQEWDKICIIIEEADTLLKIDCVRRDGLRVMESLNQAIQREGVCLYER